MITLITTQCVNSKVIKINTAGGSDNTTCCVDGECVCTSLSTALLYMANNTIINITSQSVTLEGNIKMGSGDLNNITITGNGATISCNNSGGVYCESCDHVIIEGITWDKCGDLNGTNTAGLTFNIIGNISLLNCTFQYSQVWAVSLLETSGEIVIQRSSFLYNSRMMAWENNCGGLNIKKANMGFMKLTITDSYFISNGHFCDGGNAVIGSGLTVNSASTAVDSAISIVITRTVLSSNNGAAFFYLVSQASQVIQLEEISVCYNTVVGSSLVAGIGFIGTAESCDVKIMSSLFSHNNGSVLHWTCGVSHTSTAIISNSSFTNNGPGKTQEPILSLTISSPSPIRVDIVDVKILNCSGYSEAIYPYGSGIASFVSQSSKSAIMNFTRVSAKFNKYLGYSGGTIYTTPVSDTGDIFVRFSNCDFYGGSSQGHGAAYYINASPNSGSKNPSVLIDNCLFKNFVSVESVIYVEAINLTICSSTFVNNAGSSVYLTASDLVFCGDNLFEDNIADNGAALYINDGSTVAFTEESIVYFIMNSAGEHGGAIYINLDNHCPSNSFVNTSKVYFSDNNVAIRSGNSMFFKIPKLCQLNTNISDPDSIMYIPCQFNYLQSTTGFHNCTTLNDTVFPIITSPSELRLYFPNNDGVNISSNSDNNMYVIFDKILGHHVVFSGSVIDYFEKPAEFTEFMVHCTNCPNGIKLVESHISVDNVSQLFISFVGNWEIVEGINVSVDIISALLTSKQIITTLIVELLPCINHPGNVHGDGGTCICYQHNVDCTGSENVIKRGYWFGSVGGTATTSLCPNRYCKFIGRNEVKQGFYELPREIDTQCENHRSGIACGECSPRHILAFGSADCISVHHCNVWMILSVAVLIVLYWVSVTVGVFGLSYMYYKFDNFKKPEVHRHPTRRTQRKESQISSGYIYGVIYFYSMVSILLDNNPYIPHGVLQFVSVLSSFAQLSPEFPGPFPEPLCSVHGVSGIDQLFFRYLHPIAVLLIILLIIGLARTRCAARRRVVVLIINHSIIDVFCLLLLLSYTSIASTSLQLLQPLWFTDIDQAYTYVSPDIRFFHGRHLGYGIVAIIFIIFIVIGLPLLLLLEPRIGIGRQYLLIIKPLLDKFRECYKIKYQWFAFYFLLCRVVIMATVFVGNKNYYNMLFYLQSACMLIAMVHIWIQPYRHESLNALDGIILLALVLVVNINTFPFLHNVVTEISVVLVTLPLLLVSYVTIRKAVQLYHSAANHSAADYDYDNNNDDVINNNER